MKPVLNKLLTCFLGLGMVFVSSPIHLYAAQANTQQIESVGFEPVGLGLGRMNSGSNMKAVIAESLKMTPEELFRARQAGKSVAELAKEKKVNLDELKDKILAKRTEQLTELVKKGSITKEQQAQKLERIKANIDYQLNSKDMGHRGKSGQRFPRPAR